MAMRIHQFQQKAEDLECGHAYRWAGAIESSDGGHVIALDCAQCVSAQVARDTLHEFALFVHFSSGNNESPKRPISARKTMRAY